MPTSYRSASANDAPRALFPGLMTFPAACFIVTLITDILYARSANMTWETFSIWLLTIGLIAAGIFVAVGLVQAFGQNRWPTMTLRIGYAIALVLALFNAFVHSRDAYTSVVPTGLTLSVLTVLVLLITWGLSLIAVRRTFPA
ncbi:DUF2231 domain-containing protein [Sphingomonas crusticola]|uniref:DUF2231 domain-containing protein n=1 Tax=Sphingomonas crusticola TaxID=1697973 RepID=UPI001967FD3E|nr:DUF2231 domain-containing protein [Sphingomonas crusticola]